MHCRSSWSPTKHPGCDLLLIAGDVCPAADHTVAAQRRWLKTEFANWIEQVKASRTGEVVWIAGNHDFALELGGPGRTLQRKAIYLQDGLAKAAGLRIYGTPWSRKVGPWAFGLPERAPGTRLDLATAYAAIPRGVDVVLTHGPPAGFLDRTRDGRSLGSGSLLARLRAVQPRLVVFGHIHEAAGRLDWHWTRSDGTRVPTTLVNASIRGPGFEVANEPVVVDL